MALVTPKTFLDTNKVDDYELWSSFKWWKYRAFGAVLSTIGVAKAILFFLRYILPMCDRIRGWAHARVCCEIIGRNMHENLQSPPFCNRINSSLLQALLAQAGLQNLWPWQARGLWGGAHVYVASLLAACGLYSMPFSCPNSRTRASKS